MEKTAATVTFDLTVGSSSTQASSKWFLPLQGQGLPGYKGQESRSEDHRDHKANLGGVQKSPR